MSIEKNFNDYSLESSDTLENNKQKVEEILKSVDGLYDLLKNTVRETDFGKLLEEEVTPRIKKIAGYMTNDKNVEEAVNAFLSYSSEGYHKEGAAIIKKDLEKELENI